MKVFISWSGKRARFVAEALREWLPDIVQVVEPWVSSEDIEAGKRWGPEIDAQLENTQFGIICVTASNQKATWLNFEAGALAKSVEASNVIPLLIDISPADLEPGPLTRFQALATSKSDLFTLVNTINQKASIESSPLTEGRLTRGCNMPYGEEASAKASKRRVSKVTSGCLAQVWALKEAIPAAPCFDQCIPLFFNREPITCLFIPSI